MVQQVHHKGEEIDNRGGISIIAVAILALGALVVGGGIAVRQKVVKKSGGEKIQRYERLIVTTPGDDDFINRRFNVEGTAWGWFEATVPVKVTDKNGVVLYEKSFVLGGDNYQRPVYFFEEINLSEEPTSDSGKLEFIDYSAKDRSVVYKKEIKVKFRDFQKQRTRKVKLFYYNRIKDMEINNNISCDQTAILAVEREIPVTNTPIQDTIKLLLKGELSEEEKQRGFETEFPLPGFSLVGALMKDGLLIFEFEDTGNLTSGGACRVGLLWGEIEKTARQFPEVKEVRFKPGTLFQP